MLYFMNSNNLNRLTCFVLSFSAVILLGFMTASAQWSQSYPVVSGGHFVFQNLPNGSYRLTASTGMAPGGVTAADAHLIFQSFANPTLINGLAVKAADANGDGIVNISDASLVLQHSLQSPSANLATDWVVDTVQLALQDSNASRSVRVLSRGDVNRSFQPAQRLSTGLNFEDDPDGWPTTNSETVVPVRISRSISIGSFQCFTLLPQGVRVLSVRSPQMNEDISFVQSNDTLRLGWYSSNGGAEMAAGATLWEMQLDQAACLFPEFRWSTLPGSEWANRSAQAQEALSLYIPRSRAPKSKLELQLYPNPTRGAYKLRFTLEQAGRVRISVQEASGRLLERMQELDLPAGTHEVLSDITPRQPGVYLIQLECTGPTGVSVSRSRLILSR